MPSTTGSAHIESFAARALAGLDRLDFQGRQQLLRLVLEDVRVQGWQVELRLRIPLDEHPPDDTTMPAWSSGNSKRGRSPRGSGRAKEGGQAMTVCVPLVNACLTCPMFVTTPEFLPQHHHQLEQTRVLIEQAKGHGHQRLAEMNRTVETNLVAIIAALSSPDGDCSGGCAASCGCAAEPPPKAELGDAS